jgi:predicted dehydrogenase/threonine dehydrogenase-like Zn-dependent dehydrogenase
MKQLFQDARSAEVSLVEVPVPKTLPGCVLVRTAASLVSAGTERASTEFASKNLFQKARMRPDLVRDVLNKLSRDGLLATISSVRRRLDQPSALGYSSAGTVVAVGEGVVDLNPGDRVACAGAGHAVHAEFACIPRLLAARVPSDQTTFEEAAFTTLGSVALHGVRTAEARLGEVVAVIGLGLLGQLTVQILKAAGCCVVGMDISSERAQLAHSLGADAVSSSDSEFQDLCRRHSAGYGADSVIIAAQSSSNDPVNLAGTIARNRAVIVAVGTVAMDIPRRTFYEKELDFRVSRSYGPGRYDVAYEQKGIDYPIGYVRWTETRNMDAFLRLLAESKINLSPLITHRFPIAGAHSAYELITGKLHEPFLGVLITYAPDADVSRQINLSTAIDRTELQHRSSNAAVRVGLLGAGNFAMRTLLPAMKAHAGTEMITAAAATGAHARHAANKFAFRSCATDDHEVLADPHINTVAIATRHHLHAQQVIAALRAGKHVFCEKPLCLNEAELRNIVAEHKAHGNRFVLMVGFNRRFSPFAIRLKNFLRDIHEPLAIHYRVNAGFLPADHWLNDPEQGGGRIIGEVCHFVDFLSFLTNSPVVHAEIRSLSNPGEYSNDNVECSLRFADGSLGTITYLANGNPGYSKERIEVFGGGSVAVLEDFRRLELVGHGRKRTFRSLLRQDKGHRAEWKAFADAVQKGNTSPIPLREIVNTMMATFALENSRCVGQRIDVNSIDAIKPQTFAEPENLDHAS